MINICETPSILVCGKHRPSTEELNAFVDEFVDAVQEIFPNCCIHFRRLDRRGCVHLLERYRDRYCIYNDDVQGTAGIVLAGMINAAKMKGTKLRDEKYLFLGAGSAGIGLANLLCSALVEEGLTLEQAQSKVYMFDINGLLESTRTDLVDFQQVYAHKHAATRDFVAAIESIRPTTIIGVSTIGGAFNQNVIETMSRINERPVILALSNPTRESSSARPSRRTRGQRARRSMHRGFSFHRFTLVEEPTYRAKPTTSTSFRQSEWPSSQRKPPVLPMRCSSRRLVPWRIKCPPTCCSKGSSPAAIEHPRKRNSDGCTCGETRL